MIIINKTLKRDIQWKKNYKDVEVFVSGFSKKKPQFNDFPSYFCAYYK